MQNTHVGVIPPQRGQPGYLETSCHQSSEEVVTERHSLGDIEELATQADKAGFNGDQRKLSSKEMQEMAIITQGTRMRNYGQGPQRPLWWTLSISPNFQEVQQSLFVVFNRTANTTEGLNQYLSNIGRTE